MSEEVGQRVSPMTVGRPVGSSCRGGDEQITREEGRCYVRAPGPRRRSPGGRRQWGVRPGGRRLVGAARRPRGRWRLRGGGLGMSGQRRAQPAGGEHGHVDERLDAVQPEGDRRQDLALLVEALHPRARQAEPGQFVADPACSPTGGTAQRARPT